MLAIISPINIVGVTFISGVILIVGATGNYWGRPTIGTVGTVIIGAVFIVGAAVTIGATVTALVRGAALQTLMQVLMLVNVITPSNASTFPQFSRQVFDAAVLWAMKTDKTNFWKAQCSKGATCRAANRTEEDEANISKLQKLGMTSTDEIKILALRDYIIKLSNVLSRTGTRDYIIKPPNVLSSFATRSKEPEPEAMAQTTSGVELQKLSVVPQTIFIATRPSEVSTKAGSSRLSTLMDVTDCTTVHAYLVPAVINLSFSSLIIHGDRERAASMSSVRPSSIMPPPPPPPNPPENRPSSPSVSMVSSTIDGSSSRTRPHLHMGSTDYQKAPAAVGSVKANATGLLVAPSISRMGIEVEEDDTVLSGRSSPVSNVGTVWAGHRSVQSTKSISMRFNINALGQLYDENSREAMVDFVPKVHEGPEASVDQIGNLISHSATVNGTAVAPDYLFFVTCSDETTSNIIYATTRATLVVLDLRTMRILQTIENPRHHGPIGTFCVDWVMVALEVRPSAQSEGMVLIDSWDIETTSLVETYETRESSPDTSTSTVQIGAAPSAISGIEAEKNPAATIAVLQFHPI
ncbi:hypothetical protein BU17DRAFT_99127 [Hysterangium stoloniferum]|nr:hypothetical protein BU17DRAFT_99127 [Hysterangium stoloniferum]